MGLFRQRLAFLWAIGRVHGRASCWPSGFLAEFTTSRFRNGSPEDYAKRLPKIYRVVAMTAGLASWQAWLLVGAVIVVCVAIEYAFRKAGLATVGVSAEPQPIAVSDHENISRQLSASLRARDAGSAIKHADQIIMRISTKLLEAPYPDESAWAADYTVWETAMKSVDSIMQQWARQPHKLFLDWADLRLGAPVPPPQSSIKSDFNVTKYKMVWLAQQSYANRRDGIFIFFTQAGELPHANSQ